MSDVEGLKLFHPGVFAVPEHLSDVTSWHAHIPFAFWLVDAVKPRVFVELGTHKGDSYFAFCQAVAASALPAACYAVDTWRGDEHAGRYDESVWEGVHRSNERKYARFSRLIRSTFEEAREYFPEGGVDLLHIDGLHTYEAVKEDFETWLPKLSSRGVVLMHDCNVREQGFGVWRLWRELAARYPHFTFVHGHGLGVLAVGSEVPTAIELLCGLGPVEQEHVRVFFSRLGDAAASSSALRLVEGRLAERERQRDALQAELEARSRQVVALEGNVEELRRVVADERSHQERASALGREQLAAERAEREARVKRLIATHEAHAQQLTAALQERDERISALESDRGRLEAACAVQTSDLLEKRRLIDRLLAAQGPEGLRALSSPRSLLSRLGRTRGVVPFKKAYWLLSGRLRPELHRSRQVSIVRESGLFDLAWYLQKNPRVALSETAAIESLLEPGTDRDPNPWFDTSYYLETNPDVAGAGENALVHFIQYGAQERRNPHPRFDVDYYLEGQPDVASSGMNPLLHYLRHGRQEGRATSAGVAALSAPGGSEAASGRAGAEGRVTSEEPKDPPSSTTRGAGGEAGAGAGDARFPHGGLSRHGPHGEHEHVDRFPTRLPDALVDYAIFDGQTTVEGWLDKGALATLVRLSELQRGASIGGAVAEIGVHHGRFFVPLCLVRGPNETALAIDIFDDQHLNVDGSGCGNRDYLEANLRRFVGALDRVVIEKADSLTVTGPSLLELTKGQRVRIFSVDGCHTAKHTMNDIRLACSTLAEGGVVIVDDFTNDAWPGVREGVDLFFDSTAAQEMCAVAYGNNKLYLVQRSHRRFFERLFCDLLESGNAQGGRVELYGETAWHVEVEGLEAMLDEESHRAIFSGRPDSVFRLVLGCRANYRLVDGWAPPEPWGTWTNGSRARLELPVGRGDRALRLRFHLAAFIQPPHPLQAAELVVNGETLERWTFSDRQSTERVALVPAALRGEGDWLRIDLLVENPVAPGVVGGSSDSRLLGLLLHSITVEAVADAAGEV